MSSPHRYTPPCACICCSSAFPPSVYHSYVVYMLLQRLSPFGIPLLLLVYAAPVPFPLRYITPTSCICYPSAFPPSVYHSYFLYMLPQCLSPFGIPLLLRVYATPVPFPLRYITPTSCTCCSSVFSLRYITPTSCICYPSVFPPSVYHSYVVYMLLQCLSPFGISLLLRVHATPVPFPLRSTTPTSCICCSSAFPPSVYHSYVVYMLLQCLSPFGISLLLLSYFLYMLTPVPFPLRYITPTSCICYPSVFPPSVYHSYFVFMLLQCLSPFGISLLLLVHAAPVSFPLRYITPTSCICCSSAFPPSVYHSYVVYMLLQCLSPFGISRLLRVHAAPVYFPPMLYISLFF